jgi:hypothetical protein
MFLHSVRSGGHVARSSASEVQNVNTLFSFMGWPSAGPTRGARTCYAKHVVLHLV